MENKTVIIDAEGCVVGRIGTFAAKKLLHGDKVVIVNSEKAVVIGDKYSILEHYHKRFILGHGVQKGPNISKVPDAILRRSIRGMIPWKRTRGREAYRNLICVKGVPTEYKDKEKIVVAKADAIKFITLNEICKLVGKGKKD